MDKSFICVLVSLTLLLICITRNIECQPTVDMESNENNFRDNDQISLLLLDRFEMYMLQTSLRLEKIENGVTQLFQQTPQTSTNDTSLTDVEMRLEEIEQVVTRLLQETLQTSSNNTFSDVYMRTSDVEMRLEKIENAMTRLLQETLQCSVNHTSRPTGKTIELNCRPTGKTIRHHVGLQSNVT